MQHRNVADSHPCPPIAAGYDQMLMGLEEIRSNWEAFGQSIPMRSILWRQEPWTSDEFFASGRQQVEDSLGLLDELGLRPRGHALDFGCGIGRLTQALAVHFETVVGVDIAQSMVDQADQFNRHPERCRYVVNTTDDLSQFPTGSFDLVYSLIALQHVGAKSAKCYLREFLRVLKPRGVAFFQLPSHLQVPAELPPDGMKAQMTVSPAAAEPIPASTTAGESVRLKVTLRNSSTVAWGPDHRLAVGGAWFDQASGSPVDDQGPWVPIRVGLQPGQEIELEIDAGAPVQSGSYLLRFQLHQGRVRTFPDPADGPAEVPVQVLGAADGPSPVEPFPQRTAPHMIMEGVSQGPVKRIVHANGGTLVAVREDPLAGEGWQSYIYIVRKSRWPRISRVSRTEWRAVAKRMRRVIRPR